jgi:hypothetical protein
VAISKIGTGDSEEWINSNGTRNLTKDTGTATGDLALILISAFPSSTTVGTPTGFTAVTPFIYDSSGVNQQTIYVFHRVIDGSEAATYDCVFTGGSNPFATCMLLTLRGDGALSFVSQTNGTPATGTTATAPSVSGTSGQGLVAGYGTSDPTTMTTPGGMTAGVAGLQNTNTGRMFFETLASTGATGTRASTLGTSRTNAGVTILLNDAGAAVGGQPSSKRFGGVPGMSLGGSSFGRGW